MSREGIPSRVNEDRPPRWVDRLRSAHPAVALAVAVVFVGTPTVLTAVTRVLLTDTPRPPAAALPQHRHRRRAR